MLAQARASVRIFLVAFATALLVPVLGFAAVILWNYAQSERAQFEKQAQSAAQTLISAVDLELSKLQIAVEALGTSPSIYSGDYHAFHSQAREALQLWSPDAPNKLAIVLRDLDSQQLVNTRVPWGQPLPKGSNPQVDRDVVRTRAAVIQGLFVGVTSGQAIASIRVPVLRNGEATHVLSIAIDPDRFLDLLQRQGLSPDWVLTLVDQNDRVIARSRDHARFVAQLAPVEFRRTQTGDRGVWVGPNLDGTVVLGAYERSPLAGWRAFVGVPLDTAEGPLRRSLWLIGALGLWALGLSYLLAVPFGRRIARSAEALSTAATRLGRGETVHAATSGLREIDQVSEALASASLELRDREAALRATETRLRATHENAAVGMIEVDREGRIQYVNEAECKLTGLSRDELVGRDFAHSTLPSDVDRDRELFRRQVAGELHGYTIEKQHARADGSVGWVRVSSTAVRDPHGHFVYAVRVVEDITERKDAEAQQRLLIEELNHRVKNTLATVQSLAFQTFRHAESPKTARERFEARLMSLSRTHNLLNNSSWTGASLKDVVAVEIEPYVGEGAGRVITGGPDVALTAPAALALGMTFHELATNAAKYGALSTSEGWVEIAWTIRTDDAGIRRLKLRWSEHNGPTVAAPLARGFGSRLIEQSITQQLDGRVTLRFAPDGLACEIEIPLHGQDDEAAEAAE
ncbi:MAG TPA: PAS domain S-box protein [Beijerinckiaceae bacterium]|nr:PAS domain S-box protein [Beijerinckiaceae bacterium]